MYEFYYPSKCNFSLNVWTRSDFDEILRYLRLHKYTIVSIKNFNKKLIRIVYNKNISSILISPYLKIASFRYSGLTFRISVKDFLNNIPEKDFI